jgi:hypothetical protein
MVGLLGAGIVRLWGATLRIDRLNPAQIDAVEHRGGKVCFAIWHGGLLPLAFAYRSRGIVLLVSRHRDGEIISQIICRWVRSGGAARDACRPLEMVQAVVDMPWDGPEVWAPQVSNNLEIARRGCRRRTAVEADRNGAFLGTMIPNRSLLVIVIDR